MLGVQTYKNFPRNNVFFQTQNRTSKVYENRSSWQLVFPWYTCSVHPSNSSCSIPCTSWGETLFEPWCLAECKIYMSDLNVFGWKFSMSSTSWFLLLKVHDLGDPDLYYSVFFRKGNKSFAASFIRWEKKKKKLYNKDYREAGAPHTIKQLKREILLLCLNPAVWPNSATVQIRMSECVWLTI
jgi:hypothetical protein